MDFPLQIFFNDINYSYRAAILKKNVLWLLLFYVVMVLLISIMKSCAERCTLQLYQTSLRDDYQKKSNFIVLNPISIYGYHYEKGAWS